MNDGGRELAVLLIEDDPAVGAETVVALRGHGMRVTHVVTGEDGLRRYPDADVVLLDLGLPDIEGTEVCRRIRERSDVPIVVLSARNREADRVEALDLGADDYLVKPYGVREVVARVNAVLRRHTADPLRLEVGPLQLDRRSHRVTLVGQPVHLTLKEFALLAALMEQPGAVQERNRLLDTVWQPGWHGAGRTLDVHVASLRRKLGPDWIVTVRGLGFQLDDPTRAVAPRDQ